MPSRATLSPPEPPPDLPPGFPPDFDERNPERSFDEPWQAEAFAMAVALHEKLLMTWDEWSDRLGAELKDAVDGSDYYQRWLKALEGLLIDKGVATKDEVETLTASWHRAAEATPHGKPILLENDPERHD